MKLTLTTLLTLALSATGGMAEGEFTGTCDVTSIKVSGKYLTAKCKNILGAEKCTTLDLNNCLKNSYGQLQADPTAAGPHFTAKNQCVSCTNEQPKTGFVIGGGGATLLHCLCNPGTGAEQASWPTAYFDLNTVVENNNGVLACYKTKGTAC
ncbi:hypothetical protein B0T25DRAFT_514995 [Lasiosphaeria hispida]|uniref:Cyanovirin-N domain-containing protein n=1 Tax=Lasiosphaeria hispida TaxID=260671 RepID=A0AAJ0HQF4_9PEZI|nr:hypothetical protein B0T25DRAFT_514995 [Lasiosphaeria hispida]